MDERLVNQRKSITMKFSSLFLLLLTKLLFYMSTAAHGAATCEPDGDTQFICGIMNAEDIIEIPRISAKLGHFILRILFTLLTRLYTL